MDAVIIFPTAHFLSPQEYKAIKMLGKPIFIANEYDFDKQFNFQNLQDRFSDRAQNQIGVEIPKILLDEIDKNQPKYDFYFSHPIEIEIDPKTLHYQDVKRKREEGSAFSPERKKLKK